MLNALSYVWRIGVNVFYVLVVLYVFSRLYDRTETLILATLGLIYVTIRSVGIGQAISFIPILVSVAKQVDSIKATITPETYVPIDDFSAVETLIARLNYKVAIDSIGLTLISLICLFQLFTRL